MKDILKRLFPDGEHLTLESGTDFCLSANRDTEAYTEALRTLKSCGYEIYTCREEWDNRFATLTCGNNAVNIYYIGCDREIRATSESFCHLPPNPVPPLLVR